MADDNFSHQNDGKNNNENNGENIVKMGLVVNVMGAAMFHRFTSSSLQQQEKFFTKSQNIFAMFKSAKETKRTKKSKNYIFFPFLVGRNKYDLETSV